MAQPLMPKATAVWLVENSILTFEQIADFCGLHELEVQAIADDEVAPGMHGLDPIANSQLTQEELDRCTADPATRLTLSTPDIPLPVARPTGARYTPVSKRQNKPDAIDWLLRNHGELTDAQIGRLLGTTKPTITAVRERTHWNSSSIRPQSPIELGFCKQQEIDRALERAQRRLAREEAKAERLAAASPAPDAETPAGEQAAGAPAGEDAVVCTPAGEAEAGVENAGGGL